MTDAEIAARALALLDLTDLTDHADAAGLAALCAKAVAPPVPVAAICIWPRFVAQARSLLGAGPVRIATVVNFPAGADEAAAVVDDTRIALAAGADEIDLVLPWRVFLTGDSESAAAMVARVREASRGKTLKVILETGEYPDLVKVRAASELAIVHGADFIKTSTGKTAHSASLPAARTMLEVIANAGRPVGLKPSGGIRSLADATGYLDLADAIMGPGWATAKTFRFGASGLHQVLIEAMTGGKTERADGPY
ncbi:2-deoxyribose-5-phosphate aldolase [Bosea sp. Root381]|uniref:deoxyribose-phosphate aldolase n=1 Tax=Bosea sp. Root381 TaxID=1736524 RepID=UPI0006F5717C|nr:deoxyribose-phosphate aldolase [Bosea sp. Root381]KRE11983.1 2-deoxyribose-5-phosphate aldolase [Bosea sp. Root381]